MSIYTSGVQDGLAVSKIIEDIGSAEFLKVEDERNRGLSNSKNSNKFVFVFSMKT